MGADDERAARPGRERPTGQAGAVSLGVARALLKENANFDKLLRDNGLLTRDSRKVERKKYGRHKARRSTQFSKR